MPEPFTLLRGIAAPLLVDDIDTDTITPMGRVLEGPRALVEYEFEPLRYLRDGRPNPDFVLNQPAYRNARILLCGQNFACGSSRETAVWAVAGLGIRCVVAPSFGDIFFSNCFKNGLLPIVLPRAEVEALAAEAAAGELTVDLERCEIATPSGRTLEFAVTPFRRRALLAGLDEIDSTLAREPEIAAFQARDRPARPWIYDRGAS